MKTSGELRGGGATRPFFRKFKIRSSLLSPNREKMPFKFHLYGLFMHTKGAFLLNFTCFYLNS